MLFPSNICITRWIDQSGIDLDAEVEKNKQKIIINCLSGLYPVLPEIILVEFLEVFFTD